MNYFKQSLTLLLITGLMIGSAQAGIKVEVDCCNLVKPALKGLSNAVDALSRVRIPTISLVNHDNHTITTVYKDIPTLAVGTLGVALSIIMAHYAYTCYKENEKTFATFFAAFSISEAACAGLCFFDPSLAGLTATSYLN